MKTILFIANNRTGMSGEVYLAKKLHEKYQEELRLVIYNINCFLEPESADGIEVINTLTKEQVEKNYSGQSQNAYEYHGQKGKLPHKQIKNYLDLSKKMNKWDADSIFLLADIKPDLIVFYDDRIIDIGLFIMKNAKTLCIPTVRVPFATQEDYRKTLKDRKYRLDLKVSDGIDINKIALKINSSLANTFEGQTRIFYPLYTILAARKYKVLNEHPWVSGGGNEDFSYASSKDEEEMIHHFSPDKKVAITGLAEDYEILGLREKRQAIREMLQSKYNYKTDKIVVFALPQLMEHDMCSPENQHENMHNLVKIMTEKYGRIFISLHPRSKKEDYNYLEEEYNAIFLEERLREVIPAADIFISTETTSTMRWAGLLNCKWFPIITEEACRRMGQSELNAFKERLDSDKTFMEPISEADVKDLSVVLHDLVNSDLHI